MTTFAVNIPPTIYNCEPYLSIPYGSNLQLTPRVYGYPTPTLTWSYKDTVKTVQLTDNQTLTDYATLSVTNKATAKYNGFYFLRASNDVGEDTCQTIVMIGKWKNDTCDIYFPQK